MSRFSSCLTGLLFVLIFLNSPLPAQSYYRLKKVVVKVFVKSPGSNFYESKTYDANLQDMVKRKEVSARWIKFNEIFEVIYTGMPDKRMRVEYVINIGDGTAKVRRYNDTLKGVYYDRKYSMTVPPKIIQEGKPFELTAAVSGPVYVDHYGGAHPPEQPIYHSDARVECLSATGLGSPMAYHGKDWKWPALKPNTSGVWRGSGKYVVKRATDNNGKTPFWIQTAIPLHGHMGSAVVFYYESINGNPSTSGGTGAGSGSTGNSGKGRTTAGRDRDGNSGRTTGTSAGSPGRNASGSTSITGSGGGPVPPWLASSQEGKKWPSTPSRTYRPSGWQRAETIWPPITSRSRAPAPVERRNPDGTATIVETPYQPTGARATSRDGAARILLADRRRVPAGDEVEIPVYLFYPRGTANLSFDLQYDPAVVQPVDKPERGALIRGSQRFRSNNVSRGLIKIAFAETQALGRSGIVAFARFKAIGSPGQRSAIRLTVTQLNDPENRPLSMDVYDGEVEIIRAGAGLPGDNDNSGRLTVWNAQSALDMDVKLIPENLRLDMDRDGRVTSADARIIFQRIEIGATDWRSNR